MDPRGKFTGSAYDRCLQVHSQLLLIQILHPIFPCPAQVELGRGGPQILLLLRWLHVEKAWLPLQGKASGPAGRLWSSAILLESLIFNADILDRQFC